ncbi:hypothetical protein [Paracoccus shanxieyensis]|uniref:Uncharacterized protein n=1 Tax=Paracoccus shanxieyensis TaxID=2675752 RepID=A0A6L6IWG5_9RHOB|nr:hypothetical protein [Paracoccus shanxieyensis]MTH64855.1 hypothetical protein [Paracoccus shanxieyensis]MTH87912.1 hypothetical protein [Paracoccus shanxieyensis]
MHAPKNLGPYDDRDNDCADAIEIAALELADQAEAAGWSRYEIWSALSALAVRILQADVETQAADEPIEAAIRKRVFRDD